MLITCTVLLVYVRKKTLFSIHCAATCGKALVCASCLAELGVSEDHQLSVWLCPELFSTYFLSYFKS